MPIGKRSQHRVNPFSDSGFAGIDLLPTANQAHDDRPIGMPVKARDEKLRLRLTEPYKTFLAGHKRRGLFKVPSPLSLIKDRHMLNRRPTDIDQTLIAKEVHVLNECLHLTASRFLLPLHPAFQRLS